MHVTSYRFPSGADPVVKTTKSLPHKKPWFRFLATPFLCYPFKPLKSQKHKRLLSPLRDTLSRPKVDRSVAYQVQKNTCTLTH
jgi:hypothetical protein